MLSVQPHTVYKMWLDVSVQPHTVYKMSLDVSVQPKNNKFKKTSNKHLVLISLTIEL